MDKLSILLISTDSLDAHHWAHVLRTANFTLQTETSLTAVPKLLETSPFDLLLVDSDDIGPQIIEGCKTIRDHFVNPLLLLTEAQKESQLLKLYSAGADEVMIKPLGPRLLIAKLHAWLHRSWNVPVAMLENLHFEGCCLEPETHSLLLPDGKKIRLTNLEFRLLHLLMSNPNRYIDSKVIIDRVWGYCGEGDGNVLKHLVYRLRRKIEPNPGSPTFLQTHPSGGYIFYPPTHPKTATLYHLGCD